MSHPKFFEHQHHNREVPLKQLKHNTFSQIKYSKCINNNINKLYTFNKKKSKDKLKNVCIHLSWK